MVYDIVKYGAQEGGEILCTEAIQAAIDDCAKNGGGTVEVPAGTYLTGTIWLRSHVELHLAHGSILLASGNLDDYNELDAYPQNYSYAPEGWCGKHLIICCECEDVAVTGTGTIDGNGEAYYADANCYSKYVWALGIRKSKNETRPGQLMVFVDSDRVTLQDIHIRNATCWCCYFTGCCYVNIRGLRIFNPATSANTDGIDIDLCRFVAISDCIIDTGDDCITFRCSRGKDRNRTLRGDVQQTEFVTVTNCVLACSSSVFRIGVGSDYIRHVRVSNIVMSRGAVGMNFMTSYARSGMSHIEDVAFDNISADNIAFPMRISGGTGYIRNIRVSNYRARCHASLICNGNWMFEDGLPGVSDVFLKDIDLTFEDKFDEITPEMAEQRGKNALHFEGIRKLRLEGVRVHGIPESWEQHFDAVDCPDMVIADCEIPQ